MANLQEIDEKIIPAEETVVRGPVTADSSIDLESDHAARKPGSVWTIIGCVS